MRPVSTLLMVSDPCFGIHFCDRCGRQRKRSRYASQHFACSFTCSCPLLGSDRSAFRRPQSRSTAYQRTGRRQSVSGGAIRRCEYRFGFSRNTGMISDSLDPDDPDMPVSTLRTWVIGITFAVIIPVRTPFQPFPYPHTAWFCQGLNQFVRWTTPKIPLQVRLMFLPSFSSVIPQSVSVGS